MKCRTAEDFNAFSAALAKQLISTYGTNANFPAFAQRFVREVCAPLRDVDVRKAASGLTTLGNEKQQAQRDAAPGSKKKSKAAGRPGLGAGKDVGCRGNDTGTYQEALDDGEFDDFM